LVAIGCSLFCHNQCLAAIRGRTARINPAQVH
jgi:hypothetical protein